MKNWFFIGLMVVLTSMSFVGCSDDNHDDITPSNIITHILSDQNADGDIALAPDGSTITISQAVDTKNILAGIDPDFGDEIRAFLYFPLGGTDGVPVGADIVDATIELFINRVAVAPGLGTVPILIELVSFDPPAPLVADDFFPTTQPALLTMSFPFVTRDAGNMVVIDVTPLMQEVQRLNLPAFQIRLRTDFSVFAGDGLIDIDDDAAETAPLLTVEYR